MSSKNDPVWSFFASVQLALVLLLLLAFTSIFGTILPQGEEFAVYVKQFGPRWAQVFHTLDLDNMYRAWWFLLLLAMLAANLIICSLDRIPQVWKLAAADPLDTTPEHVNRMKGGETITISCPADEAQHAVAQIFAAHRLKPRVKKTEQGLIIAGQQGGWTRFGVYIVHCSILVIMIGAIIGTVFGFKAFVMLPEDRTTDTVYATDRNQTPLPLGFEIRCNRFTLGHYPNGMPSEYRSDLTILEKGVPVLSREIVVNDPLVYKGITFYQASYQPLETYFLTISEATGQRRQTLDVPPGQERKWKEAGLSVGILNVQGPDRMGRYRLKLWFSDGSGTPAVFWLDSDNGADLSLGERKFFITSKQAFATGLQVAKDPGVWWVYIGCILMLTGLFVAFFLSHKRVWAVLTPDGTSTTRIRLAGSANKNRVGFARVLTEITHSIRNHTSSEASS